MAKTFIRFQLHKARQDKKGFAPVKVVYQLAKQKGEPTPERKFIPLDLKINPANWHKGKGRYLNRALAKKVWEQVNPKDLPFNYNMLLLEKDVDSFNANLNDIQKELRKIEQNFEYNGENWLLQDVIDIYRERHSEKPQAQKAAPKMYIDDFVEDYVKRNKGLVNAGTLQTYAAMCNQIKAFGYKKENRITFANLDKIKLDDLLKHYVKQGYNNSTTSKHFSNLKKMIRIAIDETPTLEANQAFRNYTPKILSRAESEPDVIILEQDEFDAIMDLDLSDYSQRVPYTKIEKGVEKRYTVSHETLFNIQNLFIFSCVTGFRFSDLQDLKREHIQGDWIKKKQVKGGKVKTIEIPLNAISKHILSLYEEQLKPLPSISNQKGNDYIKVLGKIAGINKKVEIDVKVGPNIESKIYPKYELMSFHMGRRVFTSLTLAKGGATHDVMSLTGHKKFASFQRYVKIGNVQKQKAMSVWGDVEKTVTKTKTA